MIQNLTSEQVNYLKSLDSKKKRREFLLDCLAENVIGESEKIIFGNFDFLKDADSPRYLFPHEMEQIQRLNTSFTESKQEDGCVKISDFPSTQVIDHAGHAIEVRLPTNTNFCSTTTAPRAFEGLESFAEKNKWDKNPKLEDIIKSKLLIRGFKNEDLLNSEGLIGATIDETVLEVVKNYQSANAEKEFITPEEALKNLAVIEEKSNVISAELLTKLRGLFLRKWGFTISFNDAKQIEEIVLKNNGFVNENTEAKFTKEDLKKAFEASFVYCRNAKYRTFNDYFKSIEK